MNPNVTLHVERDGMANKGEDFYASFDVVVLVNASPDAQVGVC